MIEIKRGEEVYRVTYKAGTLPDFWVHHNGELVAKKDFFSTCFVYWRGLRWANRKINDHYRMLKKIERMNAPKKSFLNKYPGKRNPRQGEA